MPKRGAVIIHILFVGFLALAWFYRPSAAPASDPTPIFCPTVNAPATCAPAPTYTPLPTYTSLPTYTPYPTATSMPTPEPTSTPDPFVLREEFDGKFAAGWRLFNEKREGWNLDKHPGWLELSLSTGINCCPDASWENLLLHELPAGDYEIETKMSFVSSGGETAGLVLCDGPDSCFYHGKNPKYLPIEFATKEAELTYLRLRREGNTVTCSASRDGAEWVEVSSAEAPAYTMAGLVATQADPEKPNSARFDYFTIRTLP